MENILDLHNSYKMLIYLADRGEVVNQLKSCNSLWNKLLDVSYDRNGFRVLRIGLRRLRSALALLTPLLPEDGSLWLYKLKQRSGQLGNVRDYDVALQGCTKYEAYVSENFCVNRDETALFLTELPRLKAMLLNEREQRTVDFNSKVQPDCILREMNTCIELLEKSAEMCLEDEAKTNAFLQSSLQIWGLKLCNKLQNLDKLNTMSQLHKLRIKVKRFRYAYEVYMDKAAEEDLLLSLKEMQDVLGSLHDGDRNIEIIDEITAKVEIDQALAQEIACFKAWREIKKQQGMEQIQPVALKLLNVLQNNIVGAELL